MHFSAGISLALLSTAANLAYGFSLKPTPTANTYAIPPHSRAGAPVATSSKSRARSSKSLNSNLFTAQHLLNQNHITLRGGSAQGASTVSDPEVVNNDGSGRSFASGLASLWAAGGVVMILGKSIKRILPIALEPFSGGAVVPLSSFQLASYISMCLWFAYVEGYKGFQLKFSPLVVARAQTLKPSTSPIHHTLLGPFYAMGLFHATKKRKIISWSVSIGVGVIVAAVKRLPYPWRNIIDAGVIVGLSWGSLSIIVEWVKAVLLGIETKMDPALPVPESS